MGLIINSKKEIDFYPNQVNDIKDLGSQEKIKIVKIFDSADKQLFSKELNQAKSIINFS